MMNNKKHGEGIVIEKNLDFIYQGSFIDDQFDGNGTIIFHDNKICIGKFKNGMKHGQCKIESYTGEVLTA